MWQRWVSIFEQATGTNETCWFASRNVCFLLPCVHLRLLKGMLTSSCLQDPQKWSNESSYAPSLSSWHQGHRGKKLVGSCSSTTQRLGPSVCVFLKNDGVVVGCRVFLDGISHPVKLRLLKGCLSWCWKLVAWLTFNGPFSYTWCVLMCHPKRPLFF